VALQCIEDDSQTEAKVPAHPNSASMVKPKGIRVLHGHKSLKLWSIHIKNVSQGRAAGPWKRPREATSLV
jgi:hypothetical protein